MLYLTERIMDIVRSAGRVSAKLALAGIVAAYSFEVVARYVFNSPTWWSAELVSYLLCILTFTMMPYVTASGGQIAVTIILETLPAKARIVLIRSIAVTGFIICAAMASFAGDETLRQFVRNVQMMAAQPIPKWWVSVWISIGFGLSAIEFLLLALRPNRASEGARPATSGIA